jgi:hypothetical protein
MFSLCPINVKLFFFIGRRSEIYKKTINPFMFSLEGEKTEARKFKKRIKVPFFFLKNPQPF